MGGVRQQGRGGGRPAGGRGVVGGVLGAADEPLGVVGGVVQGAVGGGEAPQHGLQQGAGQLQPAALAGHRVQGEEALGHIAVVLQHPGPGARGAVAGSARQAPARIEVDGDQQIGGGGGRLHQVGAVEVGAGLGQRGDRQPVPGGDGLVVPAGARTRGAGVQQPAAHRLDPFGVRGTVGVREPEDGGPLLEGALLGHPEVGGGQLRVLISEDLAQFGGRPDVVRALPVPPGAVVAVGVQRGGEGALGSAQFADHEVGRPQRDPPRPLTAGGAPQVRVHPAQQRVVVEHLLEVGHRPRGVHRVAGEAAAELVVEATARHRLAGRLHHLQCALGAGAGVVAQQELQHHRRRELRRAAEAAVPRVELAGQPEQCRAHLLRPGRTRGVPAVAVADAPPRQVRHDPPGHLGDLLAPVGPGGAHPFQHLAEGGHPVPGLGREVGAEVERFAVRRQEDGHGPAALPGGGLDRLHVDGVDVRALLAVHLDGHVVGVEVLGGDLVLEGLLGHHMAPVAGAVADAEQHRHVPPPRLVERLRRPGPPVDGVVRVLEEVGGRLTGQSVRHASHPALRSGPARRPVIRRPGYRYHSALGGPTPGRGG